jgi:hypothetical protein
VRWMRVLCSCSVRRWVVCSPSPSVPTEAVEMARRRVAQNAMRARNGLCGTCGFRQAEVVRFWEQSVSRHCCSRVARRAETGRSARASSVWGFGGDSRHCQVIFGRARSLRAAFGLNGRGGPRGGQWGIHARSLLHVRCVNSHCDFGAWRPRL